MDTFRTTNVHSTILKHLMIECFTTYSIVYLNTKIMNQYRRNKYSEEAYEQFSRICKALGSSRRFELLDLLSQGEHTVEELANETGMSIANTSQHLQHLKNSHLVSVRRHRNEMIYRLKDASLIEVLEAVENVAEDYLAEMDRIKNKLERERMEIKMISFSDLVNLQNDGEIQLIDVRPKSEYQAGHLPGAIWISLEELSTRLGELSLDKTIVVYCRGLYSMLSDEAVTLLTSNHFNAFRLDWGIKKWRLEGRQVEI